MLYCFFGIGIVRLPRIFFLYIVFGDDPFIPGVETVYRDICLRVVIRRANGEYGFADQESDTQPEFTEIFQHIILFLNIGDELGRILVIAGRRSFPWVWKKTIRATHTSIQVLRDDSSRNRSCLHRNCTFSVPLPAPHLALYPRLYFM